MDMPEILVNVLPPIKVTHIYTLHLNKGENSKNYPYLLKIEPKREGFVFEYELTNLNESHIVYAAGELKEKLRVTEIDAMLQKGPVQVRRGR